MESLYLLIPVALAVLLLAIKMLFWAIGSGQYDDLDTEAHRILFDEDTHHAHKDKTISQENERET